MLGLALILIFGTAKLGSAHSNGTFENVNIKDLSFSQTKLYNDTLKEGMINIYHIKLDKQNALDLMRLTISIKNEEEFEKFGKSPILDVTASNGRDSVILKLPTVLKDDRLLYSDGKLLDPIMPEDFGVNKKKNKNNLAQTLIVTVQSRLHQDIDFTLNFKSLDRSQYVVRFKNSTVRLDNQHLTFVKPIGFFVDSEEQKIRSMKLTITSDDQLCATLVTIPSNQSLYESRIESNGLNFQRLITFNTRADVYFSENEISQFPSFRVFVFINPDDMACDPEAEKRKHLEINKKMSFEFVRIDSHPYFAPIFTMIALFVLPVLGFAGFISFSGVKAVGGGGNSPNLINLNEENGEFENYMQVHEFSGNVPVAQDQPEIQHDSLSAHGEMLKYPIAIILPVFMHTALEYHKWSTSSMANRDEMCFHNHACAQPYGEFRAINNIVSNVGYLVFGMAFVGITMQKRARRRLLKNTGVFECTLLDVTIGVFLMMQALASATYHICPSDVAFQFDTPFIQVICGLLVLRQWLVRKESPSAAYSNSLLVIVVLSSFLISAMSKSSMVRYIMAFIHLSAVFTVCSLKRRSLTSDPSVPRNNHSLIFTAVFTTVNLLCVILYLPHSSFLHVNQVFTNLTIINCALYIIYYTSMKVLCFEKIPNSAKIYAFLAVVTWIFSIYFFIQDDTDWTKTAAQSRALNKPCLIFNFFGSHDLWHILSAFASLFTFLFVSYVDDDILNVPRNAIHVF